MSLFSPFPDGVEVGELTVVCVCDVEKESCADCEAVRVGGWGCLMCCFCSSGVKAVL